MVNRSSSIGVTVVTAAAAASTVIGLLLLWKRKQLLSTSSKNQKDDDTTTVIIENSDDVPPVREIITTSRTTNDDNNSNNNENSNITNKRRILERNMITIVHGSMTGTTEKFAKDLYQDINNNIHNSNYEIQLGTTEDFDWWDELINDDNDDNDENNNKKNNNNDIATLILFLPTYTNGTWTPCSIGLQDALKDLQNDWRIENFPLKKKLQVAVFGMGSSEYDNTIGQPAKQAVKALHKLGAQVLVRLQIGDDAIGTHAQNAYIKWKKQLYNKMKLLENNKDINKNQNTTCNKDDCCQKTTTKSSTTTKLENNTGCCGNSSNNNQHLSKDDNTNEYDSDDDDDNNNNDDDREPEIIDLEDMGDAILASKEEDKSSEPREMVTPNQAKALKKEGYKLIGTHSAVKLCRWTKHQLRGRGGCYKHTMYGITSYQCMEATPSLACANKCVFCWRHHKNPVGKEWKWKTDNPKYIIEQAIQTHIQMIKETRGIPGIQLNRWYDAHTVKHCALSLVGEPIMYPHINELLYELHIRNISSFLVTNGQHPNAIETLRPVTQLYVSVDAPTKDSLIDIDRPLFNDAWERLRTSLSLLKDKGQRTVARLTVVKGWNSDEISGYAELIALGYVSLIEIKGVTYCGKSDASNLNMTNTPWHHEIIQLTKTLKYELDKLRTTTHPTLPEYDLACEHKHSCSVLLARVDQFAKTDTVTGKRIWYTWINYDKFHELATKHEQDPSFTFTVTDYIAETPSWALFGSNEEGFDPTDQRHRRKQKYPKYTQFDNDGVPTHDENNQELSSEEREKLKMMMEQRKKQIGEGSTVTQLKGGAKEISDASLMFRGLVVVK